MYNMYFFFFFGMVEEKVLKSENGFERLYNIYGRTTAAFRSIRS